MKNLKKIIKDTIICGAIAYTLIDGGGKLTDYIKNRVYGDTYNNLMIISDSKNGRTVIFESESNGNIYIPLDTSRDIFPTKDVIFKGRSRLWYVKNPDSLGDSK